MNPSSSLPLLERNIIFVGGKGGVGKTVVSRTIAERLADLKQNTLWVTIEDPLRPRGDTQVIRPYLSSLNCDASVAFEEYIGLKIGVSALTKVFVQNKLMRFLSQAAPGIHELVLLGKIWHERLNYAHVVVDMPSTGYGLAMFHSTQNFSRLFPTGPVHKDAEAMLDTFRSPRDTAHLIVSLPEEMPLQESLELADFLKKIFPDNPSFFWANRVFPDPGEMATSTDHSPSPKAGARPYTEEASVYLQERFRLEKSNLNTWDQAGVKYSRLPYLPPMLSTEDRPVDSVATLSTQLKEFLP